MVERLCPKFFGNQHVGGYDDLKKIYDEGRIFALLEKMKIRVACIQINSSSNAQKNIEMLEKSFLVIKLLKQI